MALTIGTRYVPTTPNGHQAQELSQPPLEVFQGRETIALLQTLMERVTADAATPDTVLAACRCSAEIAQLLRIYLEAEKLRRQRS